MSPNPLKFCNSHAKSAGLAGQYNRVNGPGGRAADHGKRILGAMRQHFGYGTKHTDLKRPTGTTPRQYQCRPAVFCVKFHQLGVL
jgi:hypothetical protein